MTDPAGIPMGYAEAAQDMTHDTPNPTREAECARALEWYGEMADALCRYGGDLKEKKPPKPEAMEAVVAALMLDAGRRAKAALSASPPPSGDEQPSMEAIAMMIEDGYARGLEDAAKVVEQCQDAFGWHEAENDILAGKIADEIRALLPKVKP